MSQSQNLCEPVQSQSWIMNPTTSNTSEDEIVIHQETENYFRKLKLLNLENERLKKIIQDYEKRVKDCLEFSTSDKRFEELCLEQKRFKIQSNQQTIEAEDWKSRYNHLYDNCQMQEKNFNSKIKLKFKDDIKRLLKPLKDNNNNMKNFNIKETLENIVQDDDHESGKQELKFKKDITNQCKKLEQDKERMEMLQSQNEIFALEIEEIKGRNELTLKENCELRRTIGILETGRRDTELVEDKLMESELEMKQMAEVVTQLKQSQVGVSIERDKLKVLMRNIGNQRANGKNGVENIENMNSENYDSPAKVNGGSMAIARQNSKRQSYGCGEGSRSTQYSLLVEFKSLDYKIDQLIIENGKLQNENDRFREGSTNQKSHHEISGESSQNVDHKVSMESKNELLSHINELLNLINRKEGENAKLSNVANDRWKQIKELKERLKTLSDNKKSKSFISLENTEFLQKELDELKYENSQLNNKEENLTQQMNKHLFEHKKLFIKVEEMSRELKERDEEIRMLRCGDNSISEKSKSDMELLAQVFF